MIKNKYLLTMKSHWFVNQVTYKAILKTLPMLTEHHEKRGVERMPKTPIHNHVKRIFPDIYRVPLFRRQWCNLLCKQLDVFKKEGFSRSIQTRMSCDRYLRFFCRTTCQRCTKTCGTLLEQS